jgi:hypothetical protein
MSFWYHVAVEHPQDSLFSKLVTIGALPMRYLDRQALKGGGGGKNSSKGQPCGTSKETSLHYHDRCTRTLYQFDFGDIWWIVSCTY